MITLASEFIENETFSNILINNFYISIFRFSWNINFKDCQYLESLLQSIRYGESIDSPQNYLPLLLIQTSLTHKAYRILRYNFRIDSIYHPPKNHQGFS